MFPWIFLVHLLSQAMELSKDRNYIHFPDEEAEIQNLRYLPKHLPKATWLYNEKVKVLLSHMQLFATPWTVALQVPLSMEFSRQEYGSGLPCPSLRHLPNPGMEPRSPAVQADSLPFTRTHFIKDGASLLT